MLFLLTFIVCTLALDVNNYQRKSIEFVDVASECYKNTLSLINEFELINDVVTEQIIPNYETSLNETDIKEYIDFLYGYKETLFNLTSKLEDKYIDTNSVKNESKYLIRILIEIAEKLKSFIEEILKQKTRQLISLEFAKIINTYIQNNTNSFEKIFNTTLFKNKLVDFRKLYYIELDDFNEGIQKWMFDYFDYDVERFESYKMTTNFTNDIIEEILLKKFQ